MHWDDLVAVALVGTARAQVPEPDAGAPVGQLLARLDSVAPERRLLCAAGVLAAWQRAGATPQALAPEARAAPADVETGDRVCHPGADGYLVRMLHGDRKDLLPEWLRALAAQGRVLSPRWLPEMLTLAVDEAGMRDLIIPLLGSRGRWLAAQNPQWRTCLADRELAAWDECSSPQRLRILAQVRRTEPDRGRELVATTWKQESAADRKALLAGLAVGLSPADEPFLEAALDDRSKGVRAVAADLLAQLPGSALVQRQMSRAAGCLILERGFLGRMRLAVSLPKLCDAEMGRDGVVERAPKGRGAPGWWLQQMLSAVPPSRWAEGWRKTPQEIVALASATDEAAILLAGWARAASRHRDAAWAAELLQCWNGDPALLPLEEVVALCGMMSPRRLSAWMVARLQWLLRKAERNAALADDAGTLDLLLAYPYPWDPELSRQWFIVLRAFSAKALEGSELLRCWYRALPDLARLVDPIIYPEASQGWSDHATWHAAGLTDFLAVLRFRYEMLHALQGKRAA